MPFSIRGRLGETYNIGGVNEWQNLKLIELLCDVVDQKTGQAAGTSRKLITFVDGPCRPRYALRYRLLENYERARLEAECHL